MILLIVFLICVFVSLGAGVLACVSDIRGMTIPNLYSLVVALSFFIAFITTTIGGKPEVFSSPWSHILSGLLTFSLTALLFGFRFIGAADSKLATAYAFWISAKDLPVFLVYMTFAGGFLAVVSLILLHQKPFKSPPEGSWMALVQNGESKVPYGVAIFVGALVAFYQSDYFDSIALSSIFMT